MSSHLSTLLSAHIFPSPSSLLPPPFSLTASQSQSHFSFVVNGFKAQKCACMSIDIGKMELANWQIGIGNLPYRAERKEK